jgi:phosphatidyl-myo-inositol alpha-mannosyltransferase
MCLAVAGRALSWRAILTAALPGAAVRLGGVLRATSIGVLLSATVPDGPVSRPGRW